MRSRSHMVGTGAEDESDGNYRSFSGSSATPKFTMGKQRPSLKSQISNPELVYSGKAWNTTSEQRPQSVAPSANISKFRRQISLPIALAPDMDQLMIPTKESSKLKHRLAQPRLSPMEYARLYLIEKALSDRERRPCELPKPEKAWYWTPHWEKFLIIPKIPDCIQREFGATTTTESGPVDVVPELKKDDSDNDSVATLKADTEKLDYPRLSLNLGGMTVLFPSIMDSLLSVNRDHMHQQDATRHSTTSPALGCKVTNENGNLDITEGQKNVVSSYNDAETLDVDRQILAHLQSTLARSLDNIGHEGQENELRRTDSWKISRRSMAHVNDPTSYYELMSQTGNIVEVGCLESHKAGFEEANIRTRLGVDAATDNLSQYSQDSVETALFLGNTEVGNLVIPTSSSRSTTRSLGSSDVARETPARRKIEFSPKSTTSSFEAHTPLAHFPITAQPSSRLSPSTFARRIIGGAGGHLYPEDIRQARLIQSASTNLRQAFSADIWTIDSEDSMLSELQPEPLRLSRRESQIVRGHTRTVSGMIQGLSEEIAVQMRDFEEEDDQFSDLRSQETSGSIVFEGDASFIEHGWYNQAETEDDPVARLKHQIWEAGSSRATQGLPRSVSATITPTNSCESMTENSPSLLKAINEPSGFTPRQRKETDMKYSIPRSVMMPDLRDSESFEESASQAIRESNQQLQSSKRLSLVPPKNEPSLTLPRQQREEAVTDLGRALPLTPHGMRSFTLWNQGHGYHVNKDESTTSSEVLNELDLASELSTTTRNFSQPSEPKKSRPKHIPIPVDAHRFSSQRYDPSTRLLSTAVASEEKTTTPSPPNGKDSTTARTPTSAMSKVFSRRHRSELPPTPRTPTTPVHWRPFDEPQEQLPCSAPWLSGLGEDKAEKMKRAAYFREKAKRESMMEKREASGRNALRNVGSKDDMQRGKTLQRRQSMESLVGWRSFISDSPEQPPTSSPLPPVPPLPDSLRLTDLASTTRDFSAPPPNNTRYKSKKPHGLKVETNKLRKPSKEGLRSARKASSSSGLRTAFKADGRRESFWRVVEEDVRMDEVVKRRRG